MQRSSSFSWRLGLAGGALGMLAPALVSAADAPADDLSKLKADLAELKERVDDIGASADAKASDSDAKLSIKGFGDIHYVASSDKPTDGDKNTTNQYSVGALDLFMNARLGDRVSFLAETAFEAGDDNATGVDVERFLVKYDFGDELNVQAGRFHTTLGWWNENFHHGEWLNTAIGRPTALNFEDSGGILPAHVVGLVFKGTHTIGTLAVDYTFETGNGRGPTSDPPQIVHDSNNGKAMNFNLAFRPLAIPGLKIGFSAYFDKISSYENQGAGDLNPSHGEEHEQIGNAYVAYRTGPWEAIAEIYQFTHERTTGPEVGKKDKDFAYYGQFGYRVGSFTPYGRYDVIQISQDNDYFPTDRDSTRTVSVGVRWDITSWNALKAQYNYIRHENHVDGNSIENSIAVQTAFAF